MNNGLAGIYHSVLCFSRVLAVGFILIFILFNLAGIELALSLQVAIAIIAIFVGIPHGAIDHLIAIPRRPLWRFSLFIMVYVLIALIAGLGLATWNLIGFQIVVIMSALHFGFGDAAALSEARHASNQEKISSLSNIAFALPAGFLPVIIPLTDRRALDALNEINPAIANWAGTNGNLITPFRNLTLALAIFSIIYFLVNKALGMAIDLALLALLALLAPPLVAFAIYFGTWHAARHTARLVPKLDKARDYVSGNRPWAALAAAVIPGLYAVIGTLIISIGLVIWNSHGHSINSGNFLWFTLVIVWSLTVPHMLTTARFDIRAYL